MRAATRWGSGVGARAVPSGSVAFSLLLTSLVAARRPGLVGNDFHTLTESVHRFARSTCVAIIGTVGSHAASTLSRGAHRRST